MSENEQQSQIPTSETPSQSSASPFQAESQPESSGAGNGAGEAQQGTSATPQPPAGLTPEAIREIVAGAVKPFAERAQPQQPEKQLSQEEINRMLNVYQVTPEFAQKMGLQPEAASILQELVTGAVRQAVTMAGVQMQNLQQQFDKRFQSDVSPLQRHFQEQREMEYRKEFMSAHPQFKGYEPVLEAIYKQMGEQGVKFETKEQAYKAIADRAQQVLKQVPGFGGQPGGNGATTPPTTRKMSTLSGGGNGGGEGGSGSGKKTTAESIFS